MYRYDPAAVDPTNVNTRFWHMIHQLAVAAAVCYFPKRVSIILTEQEAAEKAARRKKA